MLKAVILIGGPLKGVYLSVASKHKIDKDSKDCKIAKYNIRSFILTTMHVLN